MTIVSTSPTKSGDTSGGQSEYERAVAELTADFDKLPSTASVRLAKRSSNLFRSRTPLAAGARLDVSAFDGVLSIDPVARTADVLGMTTYEHLVDATLEHGLMPLVVPQLKTITLGGAVTGLGIESSSYRNGMPHESVLEMDVLTGCGQVVTATPENEHSDLFFGFPNSYGTLGYALRLKIELEVVHPFVHLRHLRFDRTAELVEALEEACAGHYGDEAVDFVDGTVFGLDECYLTLGSWSDTAPELSDYTRTEIYYRSIQSRSEDWLTVRDYIWRWDTDWFWCSRAFGVQRRWVRQLLGRRFLRSDVYARILRIEERHHIKARLDRFRGLPERESVVQDVEIPVNRLTDFTADFLAEIPILPFWLCPLRQRDSTRAWPLYPLDPMTLYVNVGFWSTVARRAGTGRDHHNRWVEDVVDGLGGRKSLYSTAFYDRERFWELYNGAKYDILKARYDPDRRLLDLYAKCVESR